MFGYSNIGSSRGSQCSQVLVLGEICWTMLAGSVEVGVSVAVVPGGHGGGGGQAGDPRHSGAG